MSSRTLSTAYWLWMLALTGAYYAFGTHKLFLWSAIGVTSSVAVIVGVLRNHPRRRLPWVLVSLALLVFTAGDAVYLVLTEVMGEVNPFPSVADVLYLAMYPLLVAGLLLLPRSSTGRDRGGVVDALILTAGFGLLSWIFLVTPYLEDRTLSTLERLTSIAYPLGDVLFLAAAALVVTSVRRTPAVVLMAVGGVALLGADVLYGKSQLSGTWSMGGPIDIGWIVFYATWGAAALHPSMASLTEPRVTRDTPITVVRLAVLTGSALIAPAVLFVEQIRGIDIDAVPIAVLSAAIFLLVLLRLAGVVGMYRQATARERSLREAGAALVWATDVSAVRRVVGSAVARLFPPGTPYEIALPLKEETLADDSIDLGVRQSFVHAPGPPRFLRTGVIRSNALSHLRAYELALLIPLVVTNRAVGEPLVGTLAVAADDQSLGSLQSPLEVLGAQAALAIDRITLNQEVARRDSERYFRTLVQNTTDAILIVDDDDTVRYASPSAATMFGDPHLSGRHILDLVAVAQRDRARHVLDLIRQGHDPPGTAHWSVPRPDHSLGDVEVSFRDLRAEPTVSGLVFTIRDVTEEQRMQRQLSYLAFHDTLTGLANRVRFSEQVREAVAYSNEAAGGHIVGVLFIDVDDFKVVNDTMGHDIGDRLLEVVATRLAKVLVAGDTAARLGGDEFAVLVRGAPDVSHVEGVAESVVRALDQPVVVDGSLVSASSSIGVATTVDASSSGDLMRQADLALYVAKGAGKGRWRRYQAALHTAMVHRLELRTALDHAVQAGDFALRYQPIVALDSGRTVGFEALLRWMDPDRGVVSPADFIDIAEDSGLIVPIGNWSLAQAMTDAARWSQEAGEAPYLSINISVRQFRSAGLINRIRRELEHSGLPPERLMLEITESLLLKDDEQVWQDLVRLREIGIRVAVDDFGTGYSSLSYLRQVAIDVMKIDKTFIDTMASSPQQRALVETIVHLAQMLGLDVVAEGIERSEDRDLLVAMGCSHGQGYLYSAAMDQQDAVRWLQAQHAAATA